MRAFSARAIFRATLLVSFAFCAAGECPPIPTNVQPAAHILTVKGGWRLKTLPALELTPGCGLAPGAEITPPAKFLTGYAKLAIVDRLGNLAVRTCNAGEDCSPPVFLPADQRTQSFWAALFEEVMRKLRSDPGKYISAIGLGDGQLNDTVVQRTTAETIDLSPAMRGLTAGDYDLEFARLDNQVKVHWDGSSAGTTRERFSAGLYQVRLKGQTGSEAWVLITGTGQPADDIRKKDAALREVINKWSADADTEGRNVRRTVYRAFLAEAAEQMYAASR